MKLYSIKDIATQTYSAPFAQPTNAAAIRIFKAEINNPQQSNIGKWPTDYELYYVCDFDEDTGLVMNIGPDAERIAVGAELKEQN